jgi:hypothetical protein
MLSKQRKYEDESRGFKAEWEEEFVYVWREMKQDTCTGVSNLALLIGFRKTRALSETTLSYTDR